MKNKIFILLVVTFILGISSIAYSQVPAPTNLTATEITWMNHASVKLIWVGSNSQMERYNVYKKFGGVNDPGNFIRIAYRIMHRTFFDHMVHPDSTYSYYVTAVFQQNESDPSNMVEITLNGIGTFGIIAGTLTNEVDNTPIANGKVKVTGVTNNFSHNLITNAAGEFQISVPEGNYFIHSMAMHFIPEFYDNVPTIQQATIVSINEGDSLNFSIALTPFTPPAIFTLSGSVTDETGNPLMARIMVFPVRMNSYFNNHLSRVTVTDSLGNYTIPVREDDTVVVFCKPFGVNYMPEYYDDKQTFAEADRIPITGNITGINFELEPRPVYNNGITGVVRNDSSEGIMAHVSAFVLSNNHNHMKRYRTVTDSLGNYSLSNLIPNEYILLAVPQQGYMPTFFRYDGQPTLNRYEADSVVVGEQGIVSGIDFIVHHFNPDGYATLSGTVEDNIGSLLAGALVFATDADNNIYSYAITDANGMFTITGFLPGTYNIVVDKMGYSTDQYSTVNFDYLTNLSQELTIVLTPDGITSIDENDFSVNDYNLNQNYPNPFNPGTIIKYSVKQEGLVTIEIYNSIGQKVADLVNEVKAAGDYSVQFNAQNFSSGVYFYQIKAGNFIDTKKMILMK